MLMPSHAKIVQPYRDPQPLFAKHGVEAQLDAMFSNHVTLNSGGYLVINPTEALVSIDVNSGRSTREHNIEDTALQTNLEAAEEIARQLRLRDLAGLIVIDFIDMEEKRNNRAVEKKLNECLKNDRARIQVGRISPFGLLEMSRQRIRTGVLESSSVPCPHCAGTGFVRSTPVGRPARAAVDRGDADQECRLQPRRPHAARGGVLHPQPEARSPARAGDAVRRRRSAIVADDSLTGTTNYAIERGEPALRIEHKARRHRRPDRRHRAGRRAAEDDVEIEVEAEGEDEAEDADARSGSDEERERGRRRQRPPPPAPPPPPRPGPRGRRGRGPRATRRRVRREPTRTGRGRGEAAEAEARRAGRGSGGGRRTARSAAPPPPPRPPRRPGSRPRGRLRDLGERRSRERRRTSPCPAARVRGRHGRRGARFPDGAAQPAIAGPIRRRRTGAHRPATGACRAGRTAAGGGSPEAAPLMPEPEPVAVVLTPPDPDRPKRAGWWSKAKSVLERIVRNARRKASSSSRPRRKTYFNQVARRDDRLATVVFGAREGQAQIMRSLDRVEIQAGRRGDARLLQHAPGRSRWNRS